MAVSPASAASKTTPTTGTPGADTYAVILAGGSGTRFWPKSRHKQPKQLTSLGSDPRSLLEITLDRLDGFVPPERRLIVTHAEQVAETRRIVGARCGIFLAEPEAKNTANALALAALEIAGRHPGGQPLMMSLHADHIIKNEAAFRTALLTAAAAARAGRLTLLGIVPDGPETGFGYIERGAALAAVPGAFAVASFREKPDRETATAYLKTGRFAWNAGLFVWRVDVLLDELKRTLAPSIARLAAVLAECGGSFTKATPAALAAAYRELPKISIDHAVLEVSKNVAVVDADIGWQDVGSWDSLDRAFPADADGNLLFGDGCLLDTRGSTVTTDGPFVAALGLTDHVVVCARGAVLVCPKSRAQDVKKVVEWLEGRGRRELI